MKGRMSQRFESIPAKRSIIDRRAIIGVLDEVEGRDEGKLRASLVAVLKPALEEGRKEISRRLDASPRAGREIAASYAFLTDQVLRIIFDFTTVRIYPLNNPTSAERMVLIAVGGYGRGEMGLHSDIDIGFVTPWKQTGWSEQVIESMLYALWDLGLKVGHSSRSLDEMVRMAKSDLTIRTALLESRYVWGDVALYDEAAARFDKDVVAGTARTYITEKLGERDVRHKRMGDSRYVVEPNLKEGKGGLRDLHTLFWIGKYMHRVHSVPELVERGLLTPDELKQFQKAENFLWAVRCHLHIIANRPEERLTFDVQREIAERMGFGDVAGRSGVERFMQRYFLTAKQVGDLTGVFLAHVDDATTPKARLFSLSGFRRAPRKLSGFVLDRGRLAIPADDWFQQDPIRLIEIFALADEHGVEIHPQAMRAANRDAKLIDSTIRNDPRANALFMGVLTSKRDPSTVLRWMNEATVFGQFVPDFGRVVAQMQFDMYHHYTVDEHSIRAIGLLARIEKGDMDGEHPHSSETMRQIISRNVLYVAVLLHDIAKGRGGDHSVLGAEVAERLCPRFGLSPAETETVAWLVRWHLKMSDTAFKRDLADFKTILDFAQAVQSPERLRLLLVLTVVDIRAVGPGIWNGWKRQLLTTLFEAAEEVLRLGHKETGRKERIEQRQEGLRDALGHSEKLFGPYRKRFTESYWIAEPDDVLLHNARQLLAIGDKPISVEAVVYPSRGATLVTIMMGDHPGLFYRMAGAIHLAGGSIIDARIHTTRDGIAVDNFLVQDPLGRPFDEASQIERLERAIIDALADRKKLTEQLAARPMARTRAEAFTINPNVLIDNRASNRYSVIEINASDRPALLYDLAYAFFEAKVTISSAHIATYGERAVDTFYVTDLTGDKIVSETRLKDIEARLLDAAAGQAERARAAA
jgi:[protein-PII] uridylyltransferase